MSCFTLNSDELVNDFIKNYIEKIFYFCLKKTGNSHEAEDLTSDIILNVLVNINKGVMPANFSAYIWQIARNRYSTWCDRKYRKSANIYPSPICDFEFEDNNANVLDELIQSEQLSALRRELAFIAADYRNIIVAYYINNISIKNIAQNLNLPEGTVMSRLHRARKILKEGIGMTREFGKLSYNPENISFIMNGLSGKNGEPWCYLERALCKNIMLAAYRTPSTAEELAIELGVALPYMEEELNQLVNSTLMKKNGNKYETNFFIVSAEAQEQIYKHLKEISPQFTKAIIDLTKFETKWLDENYPDWYGKYQPFADMKWALLMQNVDNVNHATLLSVPDNNCKSDNIGAWGHTIRSCGGEWDILGMEAYHGTKPHFVGLHGCVSSPEERDFEEIMFRHYKFQYKHLADKTPVFLTYLQGKALVEIAKGNAKNVDKVIITQLLKYGYIEKSNNEYKPTFAVIYKNKFDEMPEEIMRNRDAILNTAKELSLKHYYFCRELIYKEIPDFLKKDTFQINHACSNIFEMRGAVLEEALRTGYITYTDNERSKMLGAYMIIN